MLTILNLMLHGLRNQRGVVSVEWLILGAVIMAAIVGAFTPTFSAALTTAVGSMSAALAAQMGLAGS